jgi:hypothetical protein
MHENLDRPMSSLSDQGRLYARAADMLEMYYNYEVLRRGGLSYPVTTCKWPQSQLPDIDQVLGGLDLGHCQKLVVEDSKYLSTLRAQGRTLYNGRTYVMRQLTQSPSMKISCCVGLYFDAITSCDAVEWELLQCLRQENGFVCEKDMRDGLQLRNRYHEFCQDPLKDGRGRSAAVSISTLIVSREDTSYRALIAQRSLKTAVHPGLYHVLPSCMFQPLSGDPRREYSVRQTIFRELLEEVFGVSEETHSVETSLGLHRHEKLASLQDLLRIGDAELLMTGVSMNLMNLRPEICTLLLLRDPHWLRQSLSSNWEFQATARVSTPRVSPFVSIDITLNDAEIVALLSSLSAVFAPPGAAAFWLGIDLARTRVWGRASPVVPTKSGPATIDPTLDDVGFTSAR